MASLAARLLGAAVDLGLVLVAWGAGSILATPWYDDELAQRGVVVVAMLPLFAVNWALTANSGRTLGKLVARTRMVRHDGRPPGVLYGVILRAWVTGWLWSIVWPTLLLDVVFVFRRDRRCVHDRLADTWVVRA